MSKSKECEGCNSPSCKYSIVRCLVHDNTIFLIDTKDQESVAIDPEAWETIKSSINQQIEEGCLDEDY